MGSSRGITSLRSLPVSVGLGVAAAVVAAAVAVATILQAPGWSRLLLAGVAGLLAVAAAIDKYRTDRRAKEATAADLRRGQDAAESKWERQIRDCLLWPAPGIRDIDPYEQLGVARSTLAESYAPDRQSVAPYVDRDIDPRARKHLQSHGAILLVGTPASGVTRTAYQLAMTVPTSPVVFVPQTPQGLTTALGDLDVLSRIAPGKPLLLWLDRVDRLTGGGLTAAMLRHCRQRSPGLRIVATISSNRFEVWATENSAVAEELGDAIVLERTPSIAELERAEATYPGVDFSQGIGAAFTVLAALLKRMKGGDQSCPHEPKGDDCALARTVVEVALEWACTGVDRPLAARRLASLARQQLAGQAPIEPEHLANALNWATSPVVGGAALLSLVGDSQGEQAVAAHKGIVEVHRAEADDPSVAVWTAALEAAGTAGRSDAVGRIGFRAHACRNASVAAEAWTLVTAIDEPGVQWLTRAVEFSRGHHDPAGELPALQRLLELNEAAYGPDHAEVAVALNNLGNAWIDIGQTTKARDLYERALRINERELGPDHPEVALTLTNLGNAWAELGQSGTARGLYERALRINERELGPDHQRVALTLAGLGNLLNDVGESAKARELLERALRIYEKQFGPDHPEIASALTSLGVAWHALGEAAKARDLHERALHINEQHFGRDHPVVAVSLGNLGNAWHELGESAKARDLHERALHINEQHFGPDHAALASTLGNLGNAWNALGQPAKARDLHERALRLNERRFGGNHPVVAINLANLGNAWRELGQPVKARDLQERALGIEEKAFGVNHPALAITLTNLGNVWHDLGEPAKAREHHERALRILYANFPAGNPRIGTLQRIMRTADPDAIVFDDGHVLGLMQWKDDGPQTGASGTA